MVVGKIMNYLDLQNGCEMVVGIIVAVLLVTNVLYSTFVKFALVDNKLFGDTLATQLKSLTSSGGRYEGMMTQIIKHVVYILSSLTIVKNIPQLHNMLNLGNMQSMAMLTAFTTIMSIIFDMLLGFVLDGLDSAGVAGDFKRFTPSLSSAPMMLLWQFILSSLVSFTAYFLISNKLCSSFNFVFMFFIAIFLSLVFKTY